MSKADTFRDENTSCNICFHRPKNYTRLIPYSGFKKISEESSKDELINILADLKTQGVSSDYMNVKLPTSQFRRLVQLERSMVKKDCNWVWSEVCASFRKSTLKYWERIMKVQLLQVGLIDVESYSRQCK
ncbi:hypothetical protein DFH28DRAFT_67111 [Melampsora americana]|nr:hypothetical protein DFH28DRAFT_67111 [Melampsora americana]